MQVTDIIGAILVGAVVGTLGRLALPGKQRIGIFVTLLIGVIAALLGTFLTRGFGIDHKAPVTYAHISWDWWVLAIQVLLAAIGTAAAAAITHTRVATDTPRKSRARSRSRG
jgi:uncharacterized membrane protein YeaQ/YmgE (transglycosylase-associated protein family)